MTRCKRIPGVDEVVCAIPVSKENDKLACEAARYVRLYNWSGEENDVLGRYWGAAKFFEARTIVRVTGDCPLISPELCGEVIRKLHSERADYASNIEPRTFPKGLDCEAFTILTLRQANHEANPNEREHVTTWMRRADIKRVNVASPWPIDGRMTLDTEADYQAIRAAFGHEPRKRLRAA